MDLTTPITPETTADELQTQVQQLTAAHQAETKARLDAEAEAEQYRKLYTETLERCRMLELGLLPKTERLAGNDAQLTLSVLGTVLGGRPPEAKPKKTTKEHQRATPTGRRPLPEDLPRVDVEVLPDEVRREGLDAFAKIGEDVSEVVERRPTRSSVRCLAKKDRVGAELRDGTLGASWSRRSARRTPSLRGAADR